MQWKNEIRFKSHAQGHHSGVDEEWDKDSGETSGSVQVLGTAQTPCLTFRPLLPNLMCASVVL